MVPLYSAPSKRPKRKLAAHVVIVERNRSIVGFEHRARELLTVAGVLAKTSGARVHYQGAIDLARELHVGVPIDRDVEVKFSQACKVTTMRVDVIFVWLPRRRVEHKHLAATQCRLDKMWAVPHPGQ